MFWLNNKYFLFSLFRCKLVKVQQMGNRLTEKICAVADLGNEMQHFRGEMGEMGNELRAVSQEL